MSLHTIGIELTNECNLRCKHCLRDFSEKPKYLSVSFIKKILREARVFNAEEISFTGGEPTLHPEFSKIIKTVKSEGYKYSLITNAQKIDHIIPVLRETKEHITRIGVSLDGSEEKINDFNRGRGSFRKVLSSIVKLKSENIPIMIQMCVGSFNRSKIESMALFASHLGINELFFAHVLPVANGRRGFALSFDERVAVEETVFRLAGELKIPIHFSVGHSVPSPVYTCVALSLHRINIDFNGYLTFCCQVSNYRGSGSKKGNPDFIVDLKDVSLQDAVGMLIDRIHLFQKERLAMVKNVSPLHREDQRYFPCDYCLRYFKKV